MASIFSRRVVISILSKLSGNLYNSSLFGVFALAEGRHVERPIRGKCQGNTTSDRGDFDGLTNLSAFLAGVSPERLVRFYRAEPPPT